MKFGIIEHYGYTQEEDHDRQRRIVSMGDILENLAIRNLYQEMGISYNDLVRCGEYDVSTYGLDNDSKYAVFPVNIYAVDINYSSYVLPVFLGLTIGGPVRELCDHELKTLRRFQPIGCRDERTLRLLQGLGIDAYLAGCLVATFPAREKALSEQAKTVYFIDAHAGVLDFIPDEILDTCAFLSHDFHTTLEELTSGKDIYALAEERICKYKHNARLIVTSKFHAAVLGLALGIPTILLLENYCYKWTWLTRYLPLYTPKDFSQIDWNPPTVVISDSEKELMRTIAKKRIRETYDKYHDLLTLSEMREVPSIQHSDDLFYGGAAIEYIEQSWDRDSTIEYALWGVTETATKLKSFIDENYPMAQLTHVFDFSRRSEFSGLVPEPSENISQYSSLFVFVTSQSAVESARDYFAEIGKPPAEYLICERKILSPVDVDRRLARLHSARK